MYAESHRHFAGSIAPETIWDIIKDSCDLSTACSLDKVREQVCLKQGDIDFEYFCTRFDILNKITWSDWAFCKAARQVMTDIKTEGIDHCTLTVSLNKFNRFLNYTKSDDLITTGYRIFGMLDAIAEEVSLDVNYLLSVSYNWPRELQIRTLKLIRCEPLNELIAGVDFVSDESMADWDIYPEYLEPWHDKGKVVRAHVGERPGTGDNIQKAIQKMKATRIAHGIYGTTKQWKKATELGVVFDVSLHSNIYTNAIQLTKHPIKRMQEAGCKITLGTDDPVQFNCNLQSEYDLAEALGADRKSLEQMAFEYRIL
jgi:adenosine deaminase